MIFEQEHFERYCNGEAYEDTLDTHLMTFNKFCYVYARAMDISIPQAVYWLKSKSVLDAGCAMGHVVKDLADNGVDANGFEPSEYAIANQATHRIWKGNNDIEFARMRENTWDIIYANSFQYTFDLEQLKRWIKHSYRICCHSVLFNSVVKNDLQSSISENLEAMQIILPREWWNQQFVDSGFLRHMWVSSTSCVYFKD